jgi:hypothetical protein
VTRWGALLLVLFVVLGLTKKPEAKAVAIAVWTTGIVLTFVMAKIVR